MSEGKLAGKMVLSGVIRCLTGLHIGGNQEVAEIGGIDLLVIRDPLSREPYLPGSSLKGKLRSLLERYYHAQDPGFTFNRSMTTGELKIHHHECDRESCRVCRLFGTSKGGEVKENRPARLQVRDAYLTAGSKRDLEQMDGGYYLTEVKFENTLDRITSAANPRQIERVPRGTSFDCQMVYNLVEPPAAEISRQDMGALFTALLLLTDDYLGGHGSRGYGQVAFGELRLAWRGVNYYQAGAAEQVLAMEPGESLHDFAARTERWMAGLAEGSVA